MTRGLVTVGLHSCGRERTDEVVEPDKELQRGRTPRKTSCMEGDAGGHADHRTGCLFTKSYSKVMCASNHLILTGKSYKLLRRHSSVLLSGMC